jgi:hypothetical protein
MIMPQLPINSNAWKEYLNIGSMRSKNFQKLPAKDFTQRFS